MTEKASDSAADLTVTAIKEERSEERGEYRKQLDGLRCFAFLLVFLDHLHLTKIDSLGCYGVWHFFAISGFVITRRLLLGTTGDLRHDLKVFYIRRALRILPIYYVVLTVMLFFGALPYAPWFYFFMANVLFAMRGNWVNLLTSPLWSLSVEEQFYLLYPVILLCTPSKWRGWMMGGLIALSMLSRVLLSRVIHHGFADVLLVVAGQYLVWGALAAWIDLNGKLKSFSPSVCIVVGLQLIGFYFITQQEPFISCIWSSACYLKIQSVLWTVLWTINAMGNAMIVLGAWRLKDKLGLAILTFPIFTYIGKISYCLYLIHELTYQPIKNGIPGFECHDDCNFMRWLSLVLSIAIGSVSWYCFEKPINDLKRKFPYRRTG